MPLFSPILKPPGQILIPGDPCAANIRSALLLTESSGSVHELVSGTVPTVTTFGGSGGGSAGPTLTASGTGFGNYLAFGASTGTVSLGAGSDMPTGAYQASYACLFQVPAVPTAGTALTRVKVYTSSGGFLLQWTGSQTAWDGLFMIAAGTSILGQTNTQPFIPGHVIGIVGVYDSGNGTNANTNVTFYWYDYTAAGGSITTLVVAQQGQGNAFGANLSGYVNSSNAITFNKFYPGSSAVPFEGNIYAFECANAVWGQSVEVADWLSDPFRAGRLAVTGSITSTPSSASPTSITLTANAPAFALSGSTPAVAMAAQGGNTGSSLGTQTNSGTDQHVTSVAFTAGSGGDLLFSVPTYGATADVTVSSASATGFSFSASPTTIGSRAATTLTVALTGGVVLSGNLTIGLTSAETGGVFSVGGTPVTSVTLANGTTTTNVTYTSYKAGTYALTATATTNPNGFATTVQTASLTVTATPLSAGSGSLTSGKFTSAAYSFTAPAGGSGDLTVKLYAIPRYETAPASGTLLHTWTNPAWPITYVDTVTPGALRLVALVVADQASSSATYGSVKSKGYAFPDLDRALVRLGQSHTGIEPSVALMYNAGLTGATLTTGTVGGSSDMFKLADFNGGIAGSTTAQWLPTDTTSETTPGDITTNYLHTKLAAARTALSGLPLDEVDVSLEFGVNDAAASIAAATTAANVAAIIAYIKTNPIIATDSRGSVPAQSFMLLSPLPPIVGGDALTPAQQSTLEIDVPAAFKALDDNATVYFCGDDLPGFCAANPQYFGGGGLHLNGPVPGGAVQFGTQVWAGLHSDQLKRLRLRKAGLLSMDGTAGTVVSGGVETIKSGQRRRGR